MKLEAIHDPQKCPHCGEEISPILNGIFPQYHAGFIAYTSNATCPICGGKWLTQVKEYLDR